MRRSIKELKKSEARAKDLSQRLKELEEKYRKMVEMGPDAILTLSPKGMITFSNLMFTKLTGYSSEEIVGKHFRKLPFLVKEEIPKYAKMFASLHQRRIPRPFKTPWLHKDGTLRWAEMHMNLIRKKDRILSIQVIGRDITEKKLAEEEKEKLQAQLLHSEKMAAVGTLTGGIAHEFNNLLQIMRGHTEFALKTRRDKDIEEALDIVMDTSNRVSRIIQDLLVFSRQETPEKEKGDVQEQIESILSLTEGQLRKHNIKVVKKYRRTPLIRMNRAEIQQVFLNIITNARHAMLPHGGKLEIGVTRSKGNIEVRISDTGKGIKRENIDRIFDPFFTTKGAIGGDGDLQGAGLGLSVSYGIVKRHGGTIEVESKDGKGTTFTVKLPLEETPTGETIRKK